MAAPKGHKRYGGRKPGTQNRVSLGVQTIIENCLGKSIPEAVLAIMAELDPNKQVDVLLDLMNYCYPKRSAVNFGALTEEEAAKLEAFRKMTPEELIKIASTPNQ